MEMLRRHGLFTLVDEGTARVVLMQIESKYHVKNPYHNAMHAADVMHGAFAKMEWYSENQSCVMWDCGTS
jgi:hypothetical protein